MCASPIDAALHDGFGRLHKANSFNTLSKEFCNRDLSEYLDDQFKGEYLDRYTLREPVASLPLYHLIGALDPLTTADVTNRPSDTLPVTLGEWIKADGLTHLKIKLAGDQLDWDVDRVLAIERVCQEVQTARGCTQWVYSCDFNEKCSSADYVIEFLNRVKSGAPAAFDRIQYIEQPTSRHLDAPNPVDMHAAAKIKPVVIDEALVSYESLLKARVLGYSGVALKACKGQSESLLMAAAAQKYGMFLCVQDLTCPGASFLHSCSLAAHVPGIAAIEGNARQYCPTANAKWAKRFPALFQVKKRESRDKQTQCSGAWVSRLSGRREQRILRIQTLSETSGPGRFFQFARFQRLKGTQNMTNLHGNHQFSGSDRFPTTGIWSSLFSPD